jgi:ABC-2 type transport system permease protein
MRAILVVYRAQIKLTVLFLLQYRLALAIWLLQFLPGPVIYLVVWTSVARAQGGQVGAFGADDFVAYYIALVLVKHVVFAVTLSGFGELVQSGALSNQLLRPVNPIHTAIAENIAYKLVSAVPLAPMFVGLVLAFRPQVRLVPWALAAAVPALLLAFVLKFLVAWTLSLAAFWVTRVSALDQVYFGALLFFSGQFVPLALYPPAVQFITYLLPFRWVIAFPLELLLGRLSPAQALAGFAAQALWLAIVLPLSPRVWRAGLRRYGAVGA